ncbi:MAG TPA: inner membrane CreD family protein [Blastocatellia bacterium]|nr:inner membrane CreD family protein [Blastocatellia bacterium]
MLKRIIAIAFVYLLAMFGWVTLGGTIAYRTDAQDAELRREVGQLWGTPLTQAAPVAKLNVERTAEAEKTDPLTKKKTIERTTVTDAYDVPIVKSNINVHLDLDQRQKGLLWYSTYKVKFTADYLFENPQDKKGEMVVNFSFPARDGLYDEFRFEVDGKEVPFTRQEANLLAARIPCEPKSRHALTVNYKSNGLDSFVYRFGDGITEVRDFQLIAATNFDGFNFPGNTISPGYKKRVDGGWELGWQYTDLIAGNSIGIEMPQQINPGPMAARISFFAPVSLAFFFFMIFVISLLRGVNIHPMNYFFLAAAFFAFHLLLAYLVDHISIHIAFLICSAVSIFLVVSYMRIVAGDRFAFFETALAQVIYLIGFSYAFFIEGFTGLAVTIGAIITLFVVMQMTARINWAEKFALPSAPPLPTEPVKENLCPPATSAVE